MFSFVDCGNDDDEYNVPTDSRAVESKLHKDKVQQPDQAQQLNKLQVEQAQQLYKAQQQAQQSSTYWSIAMEHAIQAIAEAIDQVQSTQNGQPIEIEAGLRLLNTNSGTLASGLRASDLTKSVLEQIFTYAQRNNNHQLVPAGEICSKGVWEQWTDVFYKNDVRCSTLQLPNGGGTRTVWIRKVHLRHLDFVLPERDIGIRISFKAEIPIPAPTTLTKPTQIRAKQKFTLQDIDTKMNVSFSLVWQGDNVEESRRSEPMYEQEVEPEQLLQQQLSNESERRVLAGNLLFQTLNLIGFVHPLSLKILH